MAEFQNWNLGREFQAGLERGQQQRRTDQFRALAGQAVNAPAAQRDSIIQQAIANDPETGFALQKQLDSDTDRRQTALFNMARGFKQIHSQNPGAAAAFYQQQLVPGLSRLGFQVSNEYNEAEVLPVVEQVLAAFDPTLAQGLPTGAREQQFIASQAGLKPGDPDYQRFYRIQAGLDPRAVTGAPKQITVEGADGRKRQGYFDPTTQQTFVFDESVNGFRPLGGGERVSPLPAAPPITVTPVSGGSAVTEPAAGFNIRYDDLTPEQNAQLTAGAQALAAAGYGEDVVSQFVNGQYGRLKGAPAAPARPQAAPAGLGVSRTPEAEAGAVTAAQEAAKTAAIPLRGQAEAAAAGQKAFAESTAKSDAERISTLRAELPSLKSTRDALQDAVTGFRNGTYTSGPIVGNIPAQFQSPENQYLLTTINDSILSTAERMKGTLSDKDVAFLKSATFNLGNKPEANIKILERKLQIIDSAIARGQGASQSAPLPAAADRPQPKGIPRPQTRAEFDALPSGALYINRDGNTYRK